jgi:hypothetical protein
MVNLPLRFYVEAGAAMPLSVSFNLQAQIERRKWKTTKNTLRFLVARVA